MKKLLAAFLIGVILIAGIYCTKDSPYGIKKSPNVFLRGVGINVNGEAQSYSKVINYIRKKEKRRINNGDAGNIEIWGNTPDGQIILRMRNVQSCTNKISVHIDQDYSPPIHITKTFAPFASDTFNVTMDSTRDVFFYITTDTYCGNIFDIDGLGPGSNTFICDMETLPMHFKTFDVEQRSPLVYHTVFTITNLDGADHINIQASLDGIAWRTIKVIQAKDIVINQPYSVEVKSPF